MAKELPIDMINGCSHCGKMNDTDLRTSDYPFGARCQCNAWQCNKTMAMIVWNDRYSVFENLRKRGDASDKELSPCPSCQSTDIEFVSDGQFAHKVICKSCGYNK